MLDIGCGIGRKTIPLTHYLTSEATYQGMDINRTGIEWCQEKMSAKFANFRFQQVDVYNKFYNPQGTVRPVDYKFPFESETFDFVTLVSVFTHMPPTDRDQLSLGSSPCIAKRGAVSDHFSLLAENRCEPSLMEKAPSISSMQSETTA